MMHRFSPETLERLWERTLETLATTGLRLCIILIVYWLTRQALFHVVDAALSRIHARSGEHRNAEERSRRVLTLQTLTKSFIGYVLLFVLILTVLETLGVNMTSVLTTAGVAGVAVGFGSQKLVRDVISGFFVVTEDQFAVGDYVTIGQATGIVEEMGLRTTRVRDDRGRVWAIANGDIAFVVNHSRGPVSSTVDIAVPAGSDLEAVEKLINDASAALFEARPDLLAFAPTCEGIVGFDASTLTLRVRLGAKPTELAAAEMAVREKVREALVEGGCLTSPAVA